MKNCAKCNELKDCSEFHKQTSTKDGLASYCKSCKSAYGKKHYRKNKPAIDKRHAEWHQSHKKEISEQGKKYYRANKVAINERIRKYQKDNEEAVANRLAKYYICNKESIAERMAAYQKENPEVVNAISAKWRARKFSQMPKDADLKKIATFYDEAQRQTKETGVQHHVDHIIPLSRGGLHHQDNLQVLTAEENLRKSNKLIGVL